MSISSQQKDSIVENRIVELISFSSNGALTCYLPDVDDILKLYDFSNIKSKTSITKGTQVIKIRKEND